MPMPVKPRPRRIESADDRRDAMRPASVVVETSQARQIINLPMAQRSIVTRAIKEGNSVGDIARYFSEQGWLRVTENTFKQYLMAFKRVYPEMCEGSEEDDTHLDRIVDAKRPSLDEEKELERLFRMQKVRLGIHLTFEKNAGLVTANGHKDVKVAGELLESLGAMRGRYKGAGRPASNVANVSVSAHEELRRMDSGEASHERLSNSLGGLIKLLDAKARTENQT